MYHYILFKVFFNFILQCEEEFAESISNIQQNIMTQFYESVVQGAAINFKEECQIIEKLSRYLNQSGSEVKEQCPVCKEDVQEFAAQCAQAHPIRRCLLTQVIITEQKLFQCKGCQNYIIDLEDEYHLELSAFRFVNQICPLCNNRCVSVL